LSRNPKHGYWEAKDTGDNLQTEIQKKIAKGYPLTNIIFEDTLQAYLYQNGKVAMQVDLTQPQQLVNLLVTFFSYTEPAHEDMKYPFPQNSPPQSCFLTSGAWAKTWRAVRLLTVCTIFVGLYVGTDCTRKCTWLLSVPISKKLISYRLAISKHASRNTSSTRSLNTTRRYLAAQTT
jgi:hypothetical protein